MDISIVIPQYGKSHLTIQCVESLITSCLAQTLYDVEIIVVDDGSPDTSALDVANAFPGLITVAKISENRGYANACNVGASLSNGKTLIMLNNDTVSKSNWVEPLFQSALRENVGIAGALLLFPDLSVQHAGIELYGQGPWPIYPYNVGSGHSALTPGLAISREVPSVTGACFAISKDLFDEVGGFDDTYLNACEDVDLNLRVRETGHKIWFESKAILIHDESSTRKWTMGGDTIRKNLDLLNDRWLDSPLIQLPFQPKKPAESLEGDLSDRKKLWIMNMNGDLNLAKTVINSVEMNSSMHDSFIAYLNTDAEVVTKYLQKIEQSTHDTSIDFSVEYHNRVSLEELKKGKENSAEHELILINHNEANPKMFTTSSPI